MPNLDDAMEALAANQTDLFLKEMDAALNDLEKLKEMAKNLQQLQQQAEKLGKDLAEQLENGQPELAQSTLQKMIDQLNAANLPPEQMEKIARRSLQSHRSRGKLRKSRRTPEAGGQTDEIRPKGRRGAIAGGRLQGTRQTDAATRRRQGNGGDAAETWRKPRNASARARVGGRANPGSAKAASPVLASAPGRRTKTSEWDGQSTAGWDNSGIERPDMAGKGETDRGEGELTDALKPTKVKGQFSPGGQMPSVTLKGVSIKGQSQVNFEESATAAQSDAQSALSQEKVPRAYQGAVKDYFDDLKK